MIYCFNNYLNDLNKIKKEKWWEIEVLSKKFKTIQGSDNFDEMRTAPLDPRESLLSLKETFERDSMSDEDLRSLTYFDKEHFLHY